MRLPIVHALIQDQDISFAVISVKDATLSEPVAAEKLLETLQTAYQCPVVLMGEENHQLFGRQEVVEFLNQYNVADLPWQESAVDIPDPSDGAS